MKKIFVNIVSSKTYALVMIGVIFIAPIAYAENGSLIASATTTLSTLENQAESIPGSSTSTMPTYEDTEKVRKGSVQDIHENDGYFVVTVNGSPISVYETATTTLNDGDGNQISIDSFEKGSRVYIFGYMRSDKSVIVANKIVLANKNKFWTLRR